MLYNCATACNLCSFAWIKVTYYIYHYKIVYIETIKNMDNDSWRIGLKSTRRIISRFVQVENELLICVRT